MNTADLERQMMLAQLRMLSGILGWYFGHSDMPQAEVETLMRSYGAAVAAFREAQIGPQSPPSRLTNPNLH